jgi:hypothetical protein
MAKDKPPQIVQLSATDLERLLTELRAVLVPPTYLLVESLLLTLQWIMVSAAVSYFRDLAVEKLVFFPWFFFR